MLIKKQVEKPQRKLYQALGLGLNFDKKRVERNTLDRVRHTDENIVNHKAIGLPKIVF